MKIELRRMVPIGSYKTMAFQCPGGLREVERELYSDEHVAHGAKLRAARIERGLSLGETARALGLRASEVCDVEFGRAVLTIDGAVPTVDAYHAALGRIVAEADAAAKEERHGT